MPTQTLTFSLVSGPSGATIDSSTGVFSWTPTESQGPGTYAFSVRVTDGLANTDQAVTLQGVGSEHRPVAHRRARFGHVRRADGLHVRCQRHGPRHPDPDAHFLAGQRTERGNDRQFDRRVQLDPDGVAGGGHLCVQCPRERRRGEQRPGDHAERDRSERGPVARRRTRLGDDRRGPGLHVRRRRHGPGCPRADAHLLVGERPPPARRSTAPAACSAGPPTEAQGPGTYTFSVRVTDGVVNTDQAVTLNVSEVNVAPSLTGVASSATFAEQTAYTFDADSTDPDPPDSIAHLLARERPERGHDRQFHRRVQLDPDRVARSGQLCVQRPRDRRRGEHRPGGHFERERSERGPVAHRSARFGHVRRVDGLHVRRRRHGPRRPHPDAHLLAGQRPERGPRSTVPRACSTGRPPSRKAPAPTRSAFGSPTAWRTPTRR